MKPKIAYLIDEGSYWGNPPDWKFYSEEEYNRDDPVRAPTRRIVYWEVDNGTAD